MSIPKDRKYFFDANNFDLPDRVEETELPPPVFSLDELGFAKDDAFEKGRQKGLQEATQMREQALANTISQISQELKFLSGAEQYRAAVYEREVLSLTETCLHALLPHFTETHGLDEVKAVISKVIANQSEQPKILIELRPQDVDAIETYLQSMQDLDLSRIEVKGRQDIDIGSCRLSWKDGSALRDHQSLAEAILKMLKPSPMTAPALAQKDKKDDTEEDSEGDM